MKLLKMLLGLAIVFGIVYTAWLIMPAYVANFQLEEKVESTSLSMSVANPPRTDDEIRTIILKEAQTLSIPLTEDQVSVKRLAGDVVIWADYTVHVNNPIRPFDLQFHPASRNKARM